MESVPQTLSLTPDAALAYLREEAAALLARPGRTALGLAGGPGTGKSTLAVQLVAALNAAEPGVAAYVPMDGFHMKHAKLEGLGTAADKGMPHTFEGAAFADFLAGLKAATGPMSGPGYSRKIEDVVEAAFVVPASARLLVVEGNYLLLATAPWWRIKPLLDRAVFIEVPRETVRARLLKRHAEEGLFGEERNRAHIERVDLPNYDLVMRSKPRADVSIEISTDD
ncbi:MAG: nucleoside/nucleotide kinase family protein [Devosia nanyangense]|uniref:Nucleoside/nucleotide kinase family protein n=1 Tax=Devosia nanyangense TaxID=1228055 RepID=A0A933NYQ3_9HYPH|nr:nucleoside/nucleotide kinase family protein [Devosia nanyangense]